MIILQVHCIVVKTYQFTEFQKSNWSSIKIVLKFLKSHGSLYNFVKTLLISCYYTIQGLIMNELFKMR